MTTDPWHYPRQELAKQVIGMFETGLSNALVFFAPRRMGKTEFLCKDIIPLAKKKNWRVFYFSFLDVEGAPGPEFIKALTHHAEKEKLLKSSILKKISKVSGGAWGIEAGIELRESTNTRESLSEIILKISQNNRLLLLMDEVQSLAKDPKNANFIATLRTVLDVNKEKVKVIFTGSSQEGLRRMFSQAKAPFFHFGQNLNFPELGKGFTDHLARMFEKVTKRHLNEEELWNSFQEMQRVPQLARALVERMALNPQLPLEEAKKELIAQVFVDREFDERWKRCTGLERLILTAVARGGVGLFSADARVHFARELGIDNVPLSSIQSALRVLQKKGLVGRYPEQRGYAIDDPNFKNWLLTIAK